MSDIPFEQMLTLADRLSPLEKVRLVEHVIVGLKDELQPKEPCELLYGIWKGVSISVEDIDEARREMWGNFPREDI
jgi:hypothetical protein